MPIEAFLNGTALLFLAVALVLSCLLYWKDLKAKIIPAANLFLVLVFVFSMVYAFHSLATIDNLVLVGDILAVIILSNLYAGLCNVVARVWVRVREMMGNKRLSIKVQLEER